MIIWSAGYLLSGKNLQCILLAECFDLPVWGFHEDKAMLLSPIGETGGVRFVDDSDDLLARASAARAEPWLIRCFGPESVGRDRALFSVRDGRSVLWSYYQALQRMPDVPTRPKPLPTLEQIIVGRIRSGDWSQRCWEGLEDGRLRLVYEDMVRRPNDAIEQMAAYLGVRPVRSAPHDLDEVRARYGDPLVHQPLDYGHREIEEACGDLFSAAHGDMMRELGYWPQAEALKAATAVR